MITGVRIKYVDFDSVADAVRQVPDYVMNGFNGELYVFIQRSACRDAYSRDLPDCIVSVEDGSVVFRKSLTKRACGFDAVNICRTLESMLGWKA